MGYDTGKRFINSLLPINNNLFIAKTGNIKLYRNRQILVIVTCLYTAVDKYSSIYNKLKVGLYDIKDKIEHVKNMCVAEVLKVRELSVLACVVWTQVYRTY